MRPLLLLLPLLAFAATDWGGLLDQGPGAKVRFGAVIGADDVYRRNETSAFAPASTQKLLTAGAVLAALGPGYRYPTYLRWKEIAPGVAANVTLAGSGDPSWGLTELHEGLRDRLDAIAAALKGAGVGTIEGDVSVAATDGRWNGVSIPEGWKDDDTVTCDGALAQAFNLGLNCAMLRVTAPDHAAWDSPGLSYPVRLAIRAGGATSLTARFTGAGFEIAGTWKKGAPAQGFALPIYDTRGWVAAMFRQALAAKGLRLVPGPRLSPGTDKQLVFFSQPLSELLKPFLKNSINLMGDAFLKSLAAGAPTAGGDLLAPGLSRLYGFLDGYGDTRDLSLHDGSGLSRTARVTPAFMLAYLARAANEAWFPALYAALPVAGVDGTLRDRMKGTPAQGVLRAKTGTLDGVYNLAGYVPRGHTFVPFVMLTDTIPALESAAKAAEDRVGVQLASTYHESTGAEALAEPYPWVPEHAGREAE